MASARAAWGIDIGNRALKAVKLVRDGDTLRVDDFELIEHEHVLSNAGDNRESLIQTALANFVQRHPIKKTPVSVGVSGQQSFARFIKLPPVEPKKIPEIVKFEAIQQIPFPLDDVEWSYQLFQSPESPDVEVGIFAMRKDLISRYIQFFTDVDLNVQSVQMNPLAVYNAVYYDQRLKGTTMLIDLGAENTDLIICDNDSVWMRSIPIGGNNFTETLVKAFKLPFAKAEDLKRNAATSKYARQIFQAMRPVFADLVAEIQRSVGFFASVHRDSRIKKIISVGGTFRLPGLQKYLQQNLSLDVERLDNIAAGAPADPKLAATFNENLLSVISAYGLALQALGEGKITSSLLPASIRREKLWKEKIPWFAAAAATFCVGTGIALGGYFFQDTKFKQAQDQRSAVDTIKQQAESLDSNWTQIQGAGATERKVIANVQSLTDYRDTLRNLLQEIEAAVPQPPAEIASALREGKPEQLKKIPRPQRQIVQIRSISSKFYPNPALTTYKNMSVNELVTYVQQNARPLAEAPREGGAGGGVQQLEEPPLLDPNADPNAAPTPGPRGYVVVIEGTSPYQQAPNLIGTTFCDALKKIGPSPARPKLHYQVTKAVLVAAQTIRENTTRQGELRTAYQAVQARKAAMGTAPVAAPTGGVRVPGAQPGQPAPAAIDPDAPAFMDRLIPDESVLGDYDFTVVAVVELDPDTKTAGQPQASAN
jgi:type IV pilus assembly protein PilM